jgi:hypothetical protein
MENIFNTLGDILKTENKDAQGHKVTEPVLPKTDKDYIKRRDNNPENNKGNTPLFKKFWVKSVNNWLCDADYNGKRLKENNPIPSFRKFYFIKSWEELNGFTKRDGYDNKELVERWLSEKESV